MLLRKERICHLTVPGGELGFGRGCPVQGMFLGPFGLVRELHMSVISIPQENQAVRGSDGHFRLRHLGQAETIVLRDDDVMRVGLRVRLYTIKASALSIISPVPLLLGEQVKIKLSNDVQRFATELRGVARRLAPTADDSFLVGIELF